MGKHMNRIDRTEARYRGLSAVTSWVKLKFAVMHLKKLAIHKWWHFLRFFLSSCLKSHCHIAMGLQAADKASTLSTL